MLYGWSRLKNGERHQKRRWKLKAELLDAQREILKRVQEEGVAQRHKIKENELSLPDYET
jgi:hypothetical protein